MRWSKVLGIWLVFLLLDWLFGVPLEWVGVLVLNVYMVLQLKSFKAEMLLFFIIADLVLYYLLPPYLIPNVANALLYAVLFVWANTLQQTWDLSFVAWAGLILIDMWFGRVPGYWLLFGAHCITFSVVFLLLVLLFFSAAIIPDPEHSYGGTVLYKTFEFVVTHNAHFIPFLAFPVWLTVFAVDYLISTSIEWVPMTVMTAISMLSWGLIPFVLFTVTFFITWYLVPFWFTAAAANIVMHIVLLSMLRTITTYEWEEDEAEQQQQQQQGGDENTSAANSSSSGGHADGKEHSNSKNNNDDDGGGVSSADEDTGTSKKKNKKKRKRKGHDDVTTWEELKGTPITYYVVFGTLLYLDLWYRNRPTFWSVLGVITAVWGLFLLVTLAIGDLAKYVDRKERQQQQQQQQPSPSRQQRKHSSKSQQQNHQAPSSKTPDYSSKKCEKCGAIAGLKLCATCKEVYYCSRECQSADWPKHKSACVPPKEA